MNNTEFPIMPILGVFAFVGIVVAIAVPLFSQNRDESPVSLPVGDKPGETPANAPLPPAALRYMASPQASAPASSSSDGPEGVASFLYVFGVLIAMLGGLLFSVADTSIHQILSTLIGLMGAIFFAAGAVVTELQRIKKQLQADAMRLATHNPQP
jgi:hypothetical protein